MKVLIIEDSRLARLELKELLQAYPQLQLVGEAADVPTALKLVAAKQPDLLLLDIDLGGATAFDLLAELVFVPKIIFTTAFAEHALQAFNYPTVGLPTQASNRRALSTGIGQVAAAVAGKCCASYHHANLNRPRSSRPKPRATKTQVREAAQAIHQSAYSKPIAIFSSKTVKIVTS